MKGVNVTRPTNSQPLIEIYKQFLNVHNIMKVKATTGIYIYMLQ